MNEADRVVSWEANSIRTGNKPGRVEGGVGRGIKGGGHATSVRGVRDVNS